MSIYPRYDDDEYTSKEQKLIEFIRNKASKKDITDKMLDIGKSFVKSKILFYKRINDIFMRVDLKCFHKFFKSLTVSNKEVHFQSDPEFDSCPSKDLWNRVPSALLADRNFRDLCFFNGTPIILSVSREVLRNELVINLITLNKKKHIENVDKMLDYIVKYNNYLWKHSDKNPYFLYNDGYHPNLKNGFPKRTFDNVFIEQRYVDTILNSIKTFVKKRDWYEYNNIPYHLGIILYGEPGTGKSSAAQAVANYFKFQKIVIGSTEIESAMRRIDELVSEEDKYPTIIICDDVDLSYKRTDPNIPEDFQYEIRERGKSLTRSLLNRMDGIGCLQNVIYIFTTNTIDGIDPALLRAGRLDVKIPISYISTNVFDKFLFYHYKKHLPKDKEVLPNLTLAEMQSDIVLGRSFNEMVEKYSSETKCKK